MNDRELTDLSKCLFLIQIDESGNINAAVFFFFISVNFCFSFVFRYGNVPNEFETKKKQKLTEI